MGPLASVNSEFRTSGRPWAFIGGRPGATGVHAADASADGLCCFGCCWKTLSGPPRLAVALGPFHPPPAVPPGGPPYFSPAGAQSQSEVVTAPPVARPPPVLVSRAHVGHNIRGQPFFFCPFPPSPQRALGHGERRRGANAPVQHRGTPSATRMAPGCTPPPSHGF
eukprot:9472427-Pyramimonas_sp.AAC.2